MSRHTGARRKAERRGRLCEFLAAVWLTLKGYRVVAFRYRTYAGEVDIVALKGDLAVFVEVKARRDAGLAVDAVTPAAKTRIRAASDVWLSHRKNAARFSQRYDIVAVLPGRLPRHFPDAF